MMHSRPTPVISKPRGVSLSFVLLAALLGLVTIAGGASRADVLGQVVVRAGTAVGLAVWIVAVPQPVKVARVPLLIVALAILLVLLQLIPLPPTVWSALPGRTLFLDAAKIAGFPQPWRPLAIVPSAAVNALFSLIIPLAAILFAGACKPHEQGFVLIAILIAIGLSGFVELAQVAGNDLANPFVNGRPGQPGGLIANRNHQALFLAIGCAALPVWASLPGRMSTGRSWMALGCVMLLVLMIIATGSRAGLLLGLVAIAAVPALTGVKLRAFRRDGLRRHRLLMVAIALVVLVLVAIALWAGRSQSLDRLRELDAGTDMRVRGLPVVLALLRQHWLFGSGFGSFDTLFRVVEPFALLKPTYFNHAHDDVLEIAMNGGLPAIALLMGALVWVAMRSRRVWRDAPLGRLGAIIILLVFIASLFDYPARTPIVMVVIGIAAVWLAEGLRPRQTDRL